MTTVSIKHPTGDVEEIPATPIGASHLGQWELRGHSFMLPLGPGDVVRTEGGTVSEVVSLAPQWIYMVDLHLPADYLAGPLADDHPARVAVDKLVEHWSRDTTVTMMHGFAMLVSSTSERWFNEKVREHVFVEHCEELRNPRLQSVALPHEAR